MSCTGRGSWAGCVGSSWDVWRLWLVWGFSAAKITPRSVLLVGQGGGGGVGPSSTCLMPWKPAFTRFLTLTHSLPSWGPGVSAPKSATLPPQNTQTDSHPWIKVSWVRAERVGGPDAWVSSSSGSVVEAGGCRVWEYTGSPGAFYGCLGSFQLLERAGVLKDGELEALGSFQLWESAWDQGKSYGDWVQRGEAKATWYLLVSWPWLRGLLQHSCPSVPRPPPDCRMGTWGLQITGLALGQQN